MSRTQDLLSLTFDRSADVYSNRNNNNTRRTDFTVVVCSGPCTDLYTSARLLLVFSAFPFGFHRHTVTHRKLYKTQLHIIISTRHKVTHRKLYKTQLHVISSTRQLHIISSTRHAVTYRKLYKQLHIVSSTRHTVTDHKLYKTHS